MESTVQALGQQVQMLLGTMQQQAGELQSLRARVSDGDLDDGPEVSVAQALQELARTTSATRRSDITKIGRPEAFTPPGDWHDWEFTLLTYLGTVDKMLVQEIMNSRGETSMIPAPQFGTDTAERSRMLYYLLGQLTRKSARKIVRGVVDLNGLEATFAN